MKAIRKSLRVLLLGYGLLGAVALTLLGGHFLLESTMGLSLSSRVSAIWQAALAEAVGSDSGAAPQEGVGAAAGSGASRETPPDSGELRREILHAADEIRLWENRIVEKIRKDLEDPIELERRELRRLMDPVAALLNAALRNVEAWEEKTGGELSPSSLEEVLLGGTYELDGEEKSLTPEEIRRLLDETRKELLVYKSREASLREQEKRLELLRGLSPTILAAILAGGSGRLPEDQVVRFLMGLDPAKVAQIFQTLSDENPERAELLMGRLLGEGPKS